MKRLTKKQWLFKKRIMLIIRLSIMLVIAGIMIALICIMVGDVLKDRTKKTKEVTVKEMFLTPNKFSRPGTPLKKVKGIVVHYTANPGTDAEANRNYFEGLKDSQKTFASSHYVIGLDGTIVQCLPLTEMSYASNNRNVDTISIECCHPSENGKFTPATYRSLVKLVAWLCGEYDLKKDDIIRHYDVTGKDCPRYYVKHEDQWLQFKNDVFDYIEKNAVKTK